MWSRACGIYGCPDSVPAVLLSDNGPQVVAAVLIDFCANVGIRKTFSTPYHPQGNSVVESYMRTLKKGLSALVAHNTTPRVATGFSPFLSHGREAVCPCSGI